MVYSSLVWSYRMNISVRYVLFENVIWLKLLPLARECVLSECCINEVWVVIFVGVTDCDGLSTITSKEYFSIAQCGMSWTSLRSALILCNDLTVHIDSDVCGTGIMLFVRTNVIEYLLKQLEDCLSRNFVRAFPCNCISTADDAATITRLFQDTYKNDCTVF